MYKMKDIKYGYLYNGENIYPYDNWDNNFYKKYLLQINNELEKTKYGVCWDFVELERYYLKQTNLNFKSYFIFSNDGMEFPNHTFIIVNLNDKFIWIEKSWEKYQGLHEYNSLNKALEDIKNKFIKYTGKNEKISIYEYEEPKKLNANEFYEHCENGHKIMI